MVRIEIQDPMVSCYEKEDALKNAFGLKDAVVIPSPEDENDVKKELGRSAATYLQEKVRDSQVIGVGIGTTLRSMAGFLKKMHCKNLHIVSLMGSWSKKTTGGPFEVASTLAEAFNADCYYISAPAIVDSPEALSILTSESTINLSLSIARKADLAIIGLGSASSESSLIKAGYLRMKDVEDARGKGGVGDILGHYYDTQGRVVHCDFMDRLMGISLEDLAHIKNVIGVAGGEKKQEAVLGALRGGYLNTLITTEKSAEAFLRSIS